VLEKDLQVLDLRLQGRVPLELDPRVLSPERVCLSRVHLLLRRRVCFRMILQLIPPAIPQRRFVEMPWSAPACQLILWNAEDVLPPFNSIFNNYHRNSGSRSLTIMKFWRNNGVWFSCLLVVVFSSLDAQETAPVQRVAKARLTPEVHSAISKGLEFLSKTQNSDGSFGDQRHPVADTSVCLMAFMLQGHVPSRGSCHCLFN
jgi:hypothetical protein